MPTFVHTVTVDTKTPQPLTLVRNLHLIFHHLLNILCVVLSHDNGAYHENLHILLCHFDTKFQRFFILLLLLVLLLLVVLIFCVFGFYFRTLTTPVILASDFNYFFF